MALYHAHHKVLSRSTRNTVASLAYRSGTFLVNSQTGEVSDYTKKNVNHVEILLPADAPSWALSIQELVKEDREEGLQKLSDLVEGAEKRADAQIYREFEIALPKELSDVQNIALANEFVKDQACGRGMLAIQNFHFDVDEKTGEKKPHCHTLLLTRRLNKEGLSPLKEREWNSKELHNTLREKWAEYVNFHLRQHGIEARVDHRSYAARGIDLEAQPKMGKGALEVARKMGTVLLEASLESSRKTGKDSSLPQVGPLVAWRRAAFLDVRVRNGYRILANPEIVLDAVSSTQSVFGLKDLEKVIGRYVDDSALKDRLLAKVLSSSEMVVLGTGKEAERPLEHGKESLRETSLTESSLRGGAPLLTTASLLQAELSLVAKAKDLGQSNWQAGVPKTHTSGSLTCEVETVMKGFEAREGFGLSEEQRGAVNHMASGNQLSCIVGYAGAGKTTALKVAKEVFESSGCAVVGLAPTGRAAQTLQESGIRSQTLHRFLRSFGGGRNQLRPKTVLVLDEAGMVDVKLFDGFLKAVEKLGVKAIVVGDGAQLQAVGAGDGFRLVTKALDPVVMADVRRQNKDWQREATKAFGRLETREALQAYVDKGHVTFVEEKVPTLEKLVEAQDLKGIVDLYTLSGRMMTRHMVTRHERVESQLATADKEGRFTDTDGKLFEEWQDVKLSCASHMAANLDIFRVLMEKGRVDPLGFASHFVTRHGADERTRAEMEFEASEIAKRWKLPPLTRESFTGESPTRGSITGDSRATQIDGRTETKIAMVAAWKASVKTHPTSSHLMLAYTNKDVADLNRLARAAMREMGLIKGAEFTYITSKVTRHGVTSHPVTSGGLRGEQQTIEKTFAVGDRLMFGKNDRGLDVKNGMMGTVESLSASKIVVRLDGADSPSSWERGVSETPVSGRLVSERRVSFSPKLYPFFDHGFAVTTHKAQGITVDRVFKLASFEEYRNLAYVGMTRHREDIQVFGSKLDFWREDVFLDRLCAENNKLALMDTAPEYVLEEKLEALPSSLTKTLERMGNHLEAMGFVAKHLYKTTIDIFLKPSLKEDVLEQPHTLVAQTNLASQTDKESLSAESQIQQTFLSYVSSQSHMQDLLKNSLGAFAQRVSDEVVLSGQENGNISEKQLAQWCSRFAYEVQRTHDIALRNEFKWKIDHPTKSFGIHEELEVKKNAENLSAIEGRLFYEKLKQGEATPSLQNIRSQAFAELQEQINATQTLTDQWVHAHGINRQIAQVIAESLKKFESTHGDVGKNQAISADQLKTFAQVLNDKIHGQGMPQKRASDLQSEKTALHQICKLADANVRALKVEGKWLDSPKMEIVSQEALKEVQTREQIQAAKRLQERASLKDVSREI